MRADGRTLTARILDLTHDCEGVADVDGKRVFVPDALPGELVELVLRKRRRKLQEADLVRVVEPSPERVVPGANTSAAAAAARSSISRIRRRSSSSSAALRKRSPDRACRARRMGCPRSPANRGATGAARGSA